MKINYSSHEDNLGAEVWSSGYKAVSVDWYVEKCIVWSRQVILTILHSLLSDAKIICFLLY
jgi:hypothetical protein